ncbi:cytochrome c biogenesis protein DipZ [Brucella sp. NBRC 12950]|uniref:cytochrome c biogenesis protein DipZ n=1 Tax=Brucella sp. NBRC 12950 TaxID=2994518 RepID=UPI00249FA019|nr:cytochrome c biogenesis protein DipZ [Brucella sp. NBRC 12950]GLU29265.1 cytochrome C biogenesis protein DipZ [Brucella sp. NBRC 12950]
MTLLIIAYLGGVLTIFSPCILPILPFVFVRAEQPFLRSALPMLIGMASTFALLASLATVGGSWVINANSYGRYAAIFLLALFGLGLVFPRFAQFGTQSLVNWGNRLTNRSLSNKAGSTAASSFILGIATGLLWAPCAGPILGLILTGAALNGASFQTLFLLLAFGAGAATSLGVALSVSGKLFTSMKQYLGVSEGIRKAIGIGVISGALAIAFGLDTGFLARISYASTASLEQSVLDRFSSAKNPAPVLDDTQVSSTSNVEPKLYRSTLPIEDLAPPLDGAIEWLNSAPLTMEQLRGKVVLVDFWTYSCINCIRTVPYVRAWAEKYKDKGLVVIGVHTPEFAFEKKIDNVSKAVESFKIDYPVAIDNDYKIWRAYSNNYWPAHYLIDSNGKIRYQHFGEGNYRKTEQAIQDLLHEAGSQAAAEPAVNPDAKGAEASPDLGNVRSPETYLGYERATGFIASEKIVEDAAASYSLTTLGLNQWGLSGTWTVGAEKATLDRSDGSLAIRFRARDLHLVMGLSETSKPVRYKITIDGKAPGTDHGSDIDAQGNGTVENTRLYQLIRQSADVKEHEFEIRFLDKGAAVYAFTFG